jgi:hypothetical protein
MEGGDAPHGPRRGRQGRCDVCTLERWSRALQAHKGLVQTLSTRCLSNQSRLFGVSFQVSHPQHPHITTGRTSFLKDSEGGSTCLFKHLGCVRGHMVTHGVQSPLRQ